MKYTDCCNVEYDDDIARCTCCGELCGFIEEDDEE